MLKKKKICKFNVDVLLNGYILTATEHCEEIGSEAFSCHEDRVFTSLDALVQFLKQEVYVHPQN